MRIFPKFPYKVLLHKKNYKLCSLSMRIAHSTAVTPFLRASSLTLRSRICSRMCTRAVMCSEPPHATRTPSSSKMDKRCSSEGARTDSIWLADATLVEAPSETDDVAVYSVPFGPPGTDGEVGGGRRCDFCGVVGWVARGVEEGAGPPTFLFRWA